MTFYMLLFLAVMPLSFVLFIEAGATNKPAIMLFASSFNLFALKRYGPTRTFNWTRPLFCIFLMSHYIGAMLQFGGTRAVSPLNTPTRF